MIKEKQKVWIEIGYAFFADEGPKALKVEVLAKKVGKSKSSFYHHFSDLEVFIDLLLEYHIYRAEKIVHQAMVCKAIDPDFVELLLSVKEDLLFNRQLRINRNIQEYSTCIEKVHKPIEKAFLKIWAQPLDLKDNPFLAQIILDLVVDNFYLRVTKESLSKQWLLEYWEEIKRMVEGIKKTS